MLSERAAWTFFPLPAGRPLTPLVRRTATSQRAHLPSRDQLSNCTIADSSCVSIGRRCFDNPTGARARCHAVLPMWLLRSQPRLGTLEQLGLLPSCLDPEGAEGSAVRAAARGGPNTRWASALEAVAADALPASTQSAVAYTRGAPVRAGARTYAFEVKRPGRGRRCRRARPSGRWGGPRARKALSHTPPAAVGNGPPPNPASSPIPNCQPPCSQRCSCRPGKRGPVDETSTAGTALI
jgi:hypothetical protein